MLVCTWRHGGYVGGQEQKHFSPLGTKLYFHVNFSRKYSFVLTPNMAALSRGCKPRIGTLSKDDDEKKKKKKKKKDDDDGSENVAKKWICVLSNLISSIWTRSLCQMQAIFPRLKFLRILLTGSKRGRKIRRRMATSSIKRQIRRFHVIVVQWTSKKCTKKRDARAELLFWSLNLLFFEVLGVVVVA